MADSLTQAAKLGDTDATLAAKLAEAAQGEAGLVNSSQMEKQTPEIGDSVNSNLLRFAHAAQQP